MKKFKDAFHVERDQRTITFTQSQNTYSFDDIMKTDVKLVIAKKKNATSSALATAISSTGGALSTGMLVPDEKVDVVLRVFMKNGNCEQIVTTDKPVSRVCVSYFEYVRIARRLQERLKEYRAM